MTKYKNIYVYIYTQSQHCMEFFIFKTRGEIIGFSCGVTHWKIMCPLLKWLNGLVMLQKMYTKWWMDMLWLRKGWSKEHWLFRTISGRLSSTHLLILQRWKVSPRCGRFLEACLGPWLMQWCFWLELVCLYCFCFWCCMSLS